MKNYFFLLLLIFLMACRNEDSTPTPTQPFNWVGSWKPLQYEYKGKIYPISSCQAQGKIYIAADMTGTYLNYSVTGGSCSLTDSINGIWSFDANTNILKVTYTENAIVKNNSFNISSLSSNEIKLDDYTRDVDGVAGIDDATLVFTKQ